jgi:hypothetical protein
VPAPYGWLQVKARMAAPSVRPVTVHILVARFSKVPTAFGHSVQTPAERHRSSLESRHLCHSKSEKIVGPVQNGRVAGPKLFELSLASASPVAKLTLRNASTITLPSLSS